MEAALILLAAAAAALALAWARERRLGREDAERGRRDLAEQRFRREAELKEQSQRTAALFDRMVEGLIVVDAAGRIRMANRAAAGHPDPDGQPRGGRALRLRCSGVRQDGPRGDEEPRGLGGGGPPRPGARGARP